jgi:antitoxin component of MazEF toxin-antitoxin module
MVQIVRKIQKIGGSLCVPVPSDVKDELGVSKGDTVRIDIVNKKMTVELVHPSAKTDVQAANATFDNGVHQHEQ